MTEHTIIEYMLVPYLKERGWSLCKATNLYSGGIPDAVYINKNNQKLYIEIKPKNEIIWSGIGQTIRVLAEPDKTIFTALVCHKSISHVVEEIFTSIESKRLGIIEYDDAHNFNTILSYWDLTKKMIDRTNEIIEIGKVIKSQTEFYNKGKSFKKEFLKNILKLFTDEEKVIEKTPNELFKYFDREFGFRTKRGLSNSLKDFNIFSKHVSTNGKQYRVYILNKTLIEGLLKLLDIEE
jgi:hypothetical protein